MYHEVGHGEGGDHAEPQNCDRAVLSQGCLHNCETFSGLMEWDITYCDRIVGLLEDDWGSEPENSYSSMPDDLGYIYVWDYFSVPGCYMHHHDEDNMVVNCDIQPGEIAVLEITIDCNYNQRSFLELKVKAQQGSGFGIAHAIYQYPGVASLTVDESNEGQFSLHIEDDRHKGTYESEYGLTLEMYFPTQAVDEEPVDIKGPCIYELYDVTGRCLKRMRADNHRLFMDGVSLSRGVYFSRQVGQDGSTITTRKVHILRGGQ